jgi:hypothetical protein
MPPILKTGKAKSPGVKKRIPKFALDDYTGMPYTEARCPLDKPSIRLTRAGLLLSLSPHPSCKKFDKKYPTFSDWIRLHPGKPVGRLLTPVQSVVYFSYYLPLWDRRKGKTRFNYSINGHTPIPEGAIIYPTYREWAAAQDGSEQGVGDART